MPDMITRCPKCATAFRISDNLLKSAKGMVRCGSCLQVFNASAHLEARPASPTPNAPPTPAQTPLTAEAAPTPISISGFLKRQDTEHEVAAEAEKSQPAEEQDKTASLFERTEAEQQTNTQQLPDAAEEEEDDEAWALELLKDDSDLNVQFKKIVENPKPAPEPEKDEAAARPVPTPAAAPAAEKQTQSDAGNYDATAGKNLEADMLAGTSSAETKPPNMDELLAEIETTTDDIEPQPPAADSTAAKENASTDKHTPTAPKPSAESNSGDTATASTGASPASRPIRESIAAIEPEPLEVDWDPHPNWKKRLLWPLLALIALLVLLGQVAWLEFNRLNTVEPYRSFYAVACQYLECTLPALVDRSKIDTSQLVVRSHPQVDDALKVDVILKNNAEFEQSFPTLLLTFSDLRNEPVASRRLAPDEYLGGELAGRTTMPIKQPIHIGLEIADPGEQAVSYSIAIVD